MRPVRRTNGWIVVRAEIKDGNGNWVTSEKPRYINHNFDLVVGFWSDATFVPGTGMIRIPSSEVVTVGRRLFDRRAPNADQVSDQHCQLEMRDRALIILDASLNGTQLIRGGRIFREMTRGSSEILREGDVLMLAGHGRLTYVGFDEIPTPQEVPSPTKNVQKPENGDFPGWLTLAGYVPHADPDGPDVIDGWGAYMDWTLAPVASPVYPRQVPSKAWQFGRAELRVPALATDDPFVRISDNHCTFTYVNGVWRVCDHSRHGTKVIGRSGRIVNMERGYADLHVGRIVEAAGAFRLYVRDYVHNPSADTVPPALERVAAPG